MCSVFTSARSRVCGCLLTPCVVCLSVAVVQVCKPSCKKITTTTTTTTQALSMGKGGQQVMMSYGQGH